MWDMAKVEVGVMNFLIVGMMAAIFIYGGKLLFNMHPVKGATEFFNGL